MSRKREEHNQRKLHKGANGSYRLTLPVEVIRGLKWRDGQKLVVKKKGKGIYIEDWEK